ncbi:hypothetical protein ABK040_007822 [Willaertia magna]
MFNNKGNLPNPFLSSSSALTTNNNNNPAPIVPIRVPGRLNAQRLSRPSSNNNYRDNDKENVLPKVEPQMQPQLKPRVSNVTQQQQVKTPPKKKQQKEKLSPLTENYHKYRDYLYCLDESGVTETKTFYEFLTHNSIDLASKGYNINYLRQL